MNPELQKQIEAIKAEFDPKFDKLNERAADIEEQRKAATEAQDKDKVAEATKAFTDLSEKVEELTAERDQRLATAEGENLRNRLDSMETALKAFREDDRFQVGDLGAADDDNIYGAGSEHVFYGDAFKALVDHDQDAVQRWKEAIGEKAMREATGSTGGFLVPDQISNELLELKVQQTVLRRLFSSVQVNSDTLRIAGQTQGLVAGWVAELSEKPLSELAFGELSVNVFQKAGMAVVSNQLLQDANRSVQNLINRDLSRRLALLEELAFIDGSGNGQPLGILNTPGVIAYDPNADGSGLASTDAVELLDAIIAVITDIYTEYQGPPNGIVMHPRTWGRLVSAHLNASDEYLLGPPTREAGRQATDPLPGYGSGPYPLGNLFGLPVYCSPSVPTNKGAADNESRVIIGRFDEGLILDHSGVTLAASEHVYFTSNQTIFRAEDRVGFTAARYPKAFGVIGGAGLANG